MTNEAFPGGAGADHTIPYTHRTTTTTTTAAATTCVPDSEAYCACHYPEAVQPALTETGIVPSLAGPGRPDQVRRLMRACFPSKPTYLVQKLLYTARRRSLDLWWLGISPRCVATVLIAGGVTVVVFNPPCDLNPTYSWCFKHGIFSAAAVSPSGPDEREGFLGPVSFGILQIYAKAQNGRGYYK